jgi:hypothetical protein
MTVFDTHAAAERYAELDESDLLNIAYLDSNYLPQAKELAVRELKKRGIVADKELLGQARREMDFRKDAVAQRTDENHGKAEAFKQNVREVGLLTGLWGFSLFAPMTMKSNPPSIDWLALLLVGAWLMFVVDAMRKYRSTAGKRLVYLVAVPAVLCAIGLLFGSTPRRASAALKFGLRMAGVGRFEPVVER